MPTQNHHYIFKLIAEVVLRVFYLEPILLVRSYLKVKTQKLNDQIYW